MAEKLTVEQALAHFLPRSPTAHKGTYGHVLCLTGSPQYRGAAVLCTLGALRAGAGLVTLAAPEIVFNAVISRAPEAMCLPLPNDTLLLKTAAKATVCLAGCGKVENDETCAETALLLSEIPVNSGLVLDAGALCAFAKTPETLLPYAARCIITPHVGEMARLAGVPIPQVLQMPADIALRYAKKSGSIVVLKGHRTLVASPDGKLFENTTGNPGLARGGSGDVLAGLIAGFYAQGFSPLDAACCGVTLHGAAADRCAARLSMQTMLPHDILNDLSEIFKEHEHCIINQ